MPGVCIFWPEHYLLFCIHFTGATGILIHPNQTIDFFGHYCILILHEWDDKVVIVLGLAPTQAIREPFVQLQPVL